MFSDILGNRRKSDKSVSGHDPVADIESRVKLFWVAPTSMLRIFGSEGHTFRIIKSSIPKDVEIQRCFYDDLKDKFCVVLKSEAFEIVPEGGLIPDIDPTTIREGV